MNSKRSMWKLLFALAGAGLLVTNCTLNSDDDDDDTSCTVGKTKSGCVCPDKSEGFQTCLATGVYGACNCEDANVGGGANTAGATNGGSSSAGQTSAAGAAGQSLADAGAGGEPAIVIDPTDCYDCLTKLCALEWDACAVEDENNPEPGGNPGRYCLSAAGDGSGQIEAVLDCVAAERAKTGGAKREAVRSCGASLGQSSDPSFFLWPPSAMTAATAGVVNCMADAPDETEPGAWADSTNIPTSGAAQPWVAGTCAKLSCTSFQPAP